MAVLEVCGGKDWLIPLLYDSRCHKVLRIQPDDRIRRKKDMRNAVIVKIGLLLARGGPLRPKWFTRFQILGGIIVTTGPSLFF